MKKLILLLSILTLVSCTPDSSNTDKPAATTTTITSKQWGGIMTNDISNVDNLGSGYANIYIDSNGIVTGGFSYNHLGYFVTYGTLINGVFKSAPQLVDSPNLAIEDGAFFTGTLTSPTQITGTYVDYGRNIHGTFIFNKY